MKWKVHWWIKGKEENLDSLDADEKPDIESHRDHSTVNFDKKALKNGETKDRLTFGVQSWKLEEMEGGSRDTSEDNIMKFHHKT